MSEVVARPVRVLSIDGGGMRGIIPALVLSAFESRAGRPVTEMFDLIVGTSTGAILSLGLTMPAPDGSPAFSKYAPNPDSYSVSNGHP